MSKVKSPYMAYMCIINMVIGITLLVTFLGNTNNKLALFTGILNVVISILTWYFNGSFKIVFKDEEQ